MSEEKRKIFTGTQKAKVALEAVKGTETVNEIAQEFGVHPPKLINGKKDLLENAGRLFEDIYIAFADRLQTNPKSQGRPWF